VYDHAGIGAAAAQDNPGFQGAAESPGGRKGRAGSHELFDRGIWTVPSVVSVTLKERKCPSPVHAAGDKFIMGGARCYPK
jgi:hypothetical protein